jgi:trans-feruloyl-CoA hydratase/vanillin synthase
MTETAGNSKANRSKEPWGNTVLVEFDEGIAWVTMNRPDKRNAMNPALNREMNDVLDALEVDDRCGVLVLTGAGESFSSGMDLKEYFRETDDKPRIVQVRARRDAFAWQGAKLMNFAKPTIAMVNGWCFGGAFTPMASCDLAIAADEATFGVSEINWGILPGGNVTKVLSQLMGRRAALHAIMTGIPFDGKKAAATGLVNESVPLGRLRERTRELAKVLLEKNPTVLHQAKVAFRNVEDMSWEMALDYLGAKNEQGILIDPEQGRQQGLKQFLDDKSYRPGLTSMKRSR